MNLRVCDCCGQRFDGTVDMCGSRRGVANQVISEEPLSSLLWPCLEFICWGQCQENKILRDTLDVTFELSEPSPLRDSIEHKNNYTVSQALWEEAIENVSESKTRA